MDANEIAQLGAKKYFKDRGVYRNPYPHGSPEFNEFERGWMQSLKRDNGRLVSENGFHGGGFAEQYLPRVSAPSPSANIDAEHYRSRKG